MSQKIVFLFLAVVLTLGPYVYVKFMLPIQKEIKYHSNRERICDQRAELIRVRVDDVVFKIPSDSFYRDDLSHCWGGSGIGSLWGCVKGQKVKTFKKPTGEVVKGFCQSENDKPFLVDVLDIDFRGSNSRGLIINLKAESNPDIIVSIDKIRFHMPDYYFIGKYCKGFKSENIFRAVEKDRITMFENPVYIEWYNREKSKFSFKSMLGKGVLMWSLSPHLIDSKEIPKIYWESYFKQMEELLDGYIIERPKFGFSEICSRFEKE